jgi:hypothetical protein
MKAIYIYFVGLLFCIQVSTAQVGIGTASPDPSSELDVSSPLNDKGVLIPRMNQAQRNLIVSPATSLLVYQTDNTPGFYYYNGTIWVGITAGASTDWTLVGNTGTSAASNFIGTTDDVDVVFRRKDVQAGLLGNPVGATPTTVDRKNTSFGANSLLTPATGYRNTVIGTNAMTLNTTGFRNVAVGNDVLPKNTSGNTNVAIGDSSMFENLSGNGNTAVGTGSLFFNKIGTNNTAIGRNALTANEASFNTALGDRAMEFNALGANNVATGNNALSKNVGGNNNTGSGVQALRANQAGNNNTAFGYQTLSGNPTVAGNVSTFSNSTAVGYQSFYNNLTGSGNVGLGYQAGFNETTGNKLYIENSNADASNALIYGEFDTNILRTNSTFQIGNPAVTGYSFPSARPATAAGQVLQYNAVGALTFQTPAAALNSSAWLTTGNSGMVANFIGTTDANPLVFRTSNVERMRIVPTGEVVVGATLPFAGDKFSVYATGTEFAVRGLSTLTGRGLQGQNSGSGVAVIGFNTGTGRAIEGQSSGANSNAFLGVNTAAIGTGTGIGVVGRTAQSAGFGINALNTNSAGTGLIATGQNVPGTYLTAGSGASINGVTTGLFALTTSPGVSQSILTDDSFGGVVRVNHWDGTTQYKILGTGTVSTTARGVDGERVVLHCTEAPEIYFEDYGQGQLVNGKAHILIDPIIVKNITVNDKHPLRVYIQLEDDCNGVFVTNKKSDSFDVIELSSGNSNAKFQYHIVGNRADEVLENGRVSKNADTRFELAPKDLETKKIDLKTTSSFIKELNPSPEK